jgi:hypothetical protein
MESSNIHHFVSKYIFLLLSVIVVSIPFQDYFAMSEPTIEWIPTILYFSFGAMFFLVFLYLKDKFVIVELGGQRIRIARNNQTEEKYWTEVDSIVQIAGISPPLYQSRFKDSKGYFLFFNSGSYFSIAGFFVKDTSEMGTLIERKKRELDI